MNVYFIAAARDTPLQQLLYAHLPPRRHPQIPMVISAGGVWQERQRLLDPDEIIKTGEVVKIYIEPGQAQAYSLKPEHIVFESPDFLVVYKPGGINVHAVPSSIVHHLAYGVDRYLEQRGIHFQSTPLTRLDQPVAGLVLFAVHKSAEKRLFRLTKRRKIKKWYLAALEKPAGPGSRPPGKYLRIQDRIGSREKRTAPDPAGKFAHSLFIRREERETATIYSVFTFTGRRHQIRFHAAHYLTPIAGDRLYGSGYRFGRGEIALLCCGYNFPFGGRHYRIRLPIEYLEAFYEKIANSKRLEDHSNNDKP
jgi:23S rRNA pseudouridine1911/1915/1917 synthase